MKTVTRARFMADVARGKVEPLILILGDCEFLIERAAQAVAGLVGEGERAFCLWRGTAAEADPDRLLEEARTLPMFGERRVLVVRGAEKLPIASHAGWQAYLRRPCAQSVVAFVATAGAEARALRPLSEGCLVVECRTPPPRSLPEWVVEEARGLRCDVDAETAAWMIEIAGRDLAALDAWLARAALYRGEIGSLARGDLEAVSGRRAPANLFAWADRVGEGRPAEALRIARRAIEDGEEPLALVGRAANHLRRLAIIERALAGGASAAEAARQAGAPAFLAVSLATQARRGTTRALARALAGCAWADRALKSARVSPPRILDRWILTALESRSAESNGGK